ncbi:Polynucleotide 5'-hydroxyl-kinase grc3, partial [Ascosphaera aggregata]
MSAVSAVAARRAKAQAQAQAQAQSQAQSEAELRARKLPSKGGRVTARSLVASSSGEPPLKKAKSSSIRSRRSTRDETTTSLQLRVQELNKSSSSSSVTSDADGETSVVEAEFETQDEPWDGLEASVLEDGKSASTAPTPKLGFEREDFLLSKTRLRKADVLYTTSKCVCIRLKLKSTLAVIGQYDLWVKRGVMSISGAKLHPSPRLYRVYAPSSRSLPIIKSVSTSGDYAEIELRSIVNTNGPYGLNKLSPLYDRIDNSHEVPKANPLHGHGPYSFSILHSSSEDSFGRSLRPLHMDKKWSRAIQELSKRSATLKVMACGPKGAGKSTFNTFLVNHLLSPQPSADTIEAEDDGVAFLDLDPGQPEFSPMGHVYLAHLRQPILGPPFTHPAGGLHKGESIIKKSTFIGSSSPKDDPDYYVSATMDLIEHYRILLQSYPRCALVVNYPGWIFGLGLEIATLFIRTLGLTDLVYMSEKGPAEVIEPLAYAAQESNVKTTILPSQPTDYVSRSSSQLRTMQMMSYFHMSQDENGDNLWSSKPLIESRPMVVSYTGDDKGFLGVMITGSGYDPDFLQELLEGSLVGIVAVEDMTSLFTAAGEANDYPHHHSSTSTSTSSSCTDFIQLNKDGIPYIPAFSKPCTGGLNPA